MWPYVADIQRDFAARAAWADAGSFEKGEHPPKLSIQEGLDFSLAPGDTAELHAAASSPDGLPVSVSFRLYRDASAICADASCLSAEGTSACLTVPLSAVGGDVIHIVVKAQAEGHYRLTHYQQIIVRVK